MERNTGVQWSRVGLDRLDLRGRTAAVIGGTGGIGRALSLQMAARGAHVTVVGQTFRDGGVDNIDFIKADLSSMAEAERVAELLGVDELDLLVLTTGIFAAPEREQTAEGIERDLAVSYLSRFVLVQLTVARLGTGRTEPNQKPRVFIMGFPGTGQTPLIDDFNSEKSYTAMGAHMNTVAGNEALVIDSAQRYPAVNFYGLNPGLMKTNIRSNMLGQHSFKHRAIETVIGMLTPSVETYAKRIVPLLWAPELEPHSGAMFDRKGRAIMPSTNMVDTTVREIIAASEELVARTDRRLR